MFRAALILLLLAGAVPVAGGEPAPLELTDCRLDRGPALESRPARCGSLAVPENPADPGSEIRLSVAVIPSLNVEPVPDPIVLLAGGPGQAASDFYLAYWAAFEPIRLTRDIVLIDQRGTGESNRLTCPDQADVIARSGDVAVLRDAMQRCLGTLNGDPRYYTTSVAVRDLDAVRRALGIERWNLYGISYGTRVAQHYMRRYPDAVRRVVLDGVIAPDVVVGPAIAIDAEAALQRIFGRCAGTDACATRFPGLAGSFMALRERLRVEPVDVEIDDPTSGERISLTLSDVEFTGAVRLLSYSPVTAALLPLLIDDAWRNERFDRLAAQVRMHEAQLADTLAIGMHNSVVCAEDAPRFDTAGIEREALAATYLGTLNLDALTAVCEIWPPGPVDEGFHELLQSAIPTLILSGSDDPVTPPKYAERVAGGLTRSWHFVGEHQGHGIAILGCVPGVMARFLETEELDSFDGECIDSLTPAPFFIDYSGPLH